MKTRLVGHQNRSGRSEEVRSRFLLPGIETQLLGCVGCCPVAIPAPRHRLFNYKKCEVSSPVQQQATMKCLSGKNCHPCSFKV